MRLQHDIRTPSITLEGAVAIVDAAIARAREMDRRVAIVVLDRFGRMVARQCMDGCVNAAFDVALAKSRHSANFRRPTKFQQDMLTDKQLFPILAIPGMMPLEGGLEIQFDGETVGGIGVSGTTAAEDAEIATAGILRRAMSSAGLPRRQKRKRDSARGHLPNGQEKWCPGLAVDRRARFGR